MKVICVGSGPNMKQINDWNTEGITVVGVNNIWKGTDKWDYLIHSGDYPFKKEITKTRDNQKVCSVGGDMNYEDSYVGMSDMLWKRARIFLGLPIYFTVSYWALHYLKPTHIGYIGFDMNYTPQQDGSTAFYGVGYDMQKRGIPDPLYQFRNIEAYKKDPNIMKTLLTRLDERSNGCKLLNLSNDENSVLPWDKINFEEFRSL